MYVNATIVITCDVIIKFYDINFCSRDPTQSETSQDEHSPMSENIIKIEKAPITLLYGAMMYSFVKSNTPQVWMYHFISSLFNVSVLKEEKYQVKVPSRWRHVAHDFYPMVDYHFKVEEGVANENLNEFCDGGNGFLRLLKLLYEFTQQEQMFGAQQAMNILNIFKSTLDACTDVYQVDNFKNMVLAWYTGILFLLTPFKTGFVDYVECDILVK